MSERMQRLLNRVSERWNKFTAGQKTLIIVPAAGTVMAIALLLTLWNPNRYILLLNGTDTKESNIVEVSTGSVSVSEADKQRRYQIYMEGKLASTIVDSLEAVKSAKVALHLPEHFGSPLAEEEALAFVTLELDGDFSAGEAEDLAEGISVALGNQSLQYVEIIDTQGNQLRE